MWEAYIESWRVKCQAVFRKYFVKQAILQGTRETFCLEDFKCDFLTFYSHYIYPHYLQKYQQECKVVIYNYILC